MRLGGIYALERIAVDSKRDHPTVVEVLGAFVREHGQPATQPNPGTADDANGEPTKRTQPTDVQAAVTVLGRLPQRPGVPRGDLSFAHLEGANLRDAHLERAILRGAHLEEGILPGAHLEEAALRGAHLEEADLSFAHLERAILADAHLKEADLRGAHLEEVYLSFAHLEGANVVNAHLEGANLVGAHLEGANLVGAHLQGALADGETAWPDSFDWQAGGVVMEPGETTG